MQLYNPFPISTLASILTLSNPIPPPPVLLLSLLSLHSINHQRPETFQLAISCHYTATSLTNAMPSSSSPGALDAVCGSFLALSIVIVGLRFYTRSMQKLPLGIDDWATLPCVVCTFRVKR